MHEWAWGVWVEPVVKTLLGGNPHLYGSGDHHSLGPGGGVLKTLGAAFIVGLLFGLGLAISGMINPEKVIGFLDVTGSFDPSLAFVMGGAMGVHILFFRLIKKRASPLFEPKFYLPTRQDLDAKLIVGSALFGVGWGIGGYCPGPAVTSLAGANGDVWLFVTAMVVGMWLHFGYVKLKGRASNEGSLLNSSKEFL